MYHKIQLAAASVFLIVILTACGSGSNNNSYPGINFADGPQTIQWQIDGNGFVQFLTNEVQFYNYGFGKTYTETKELQMTTVTASMVKKSGSLNSGHGIIFCTQDSNNFYRLLIDATGYYVVESCVGGTYTTIIPWSKAKTAILNSGVGVLNKISVMQQSPHIFTVS